MSNLNYKINQELCSDPMIVLKDKDSCSIRLKNPDRKKVYKVIVDDGLIADRDGKNSSKCDYLVYSYEDYKLIVYIELKGKNIENAIKQLEATIQVTRDDFKGYEKRKAYISSKTSPKTIFRQKQVQFARKNGVPLFICTPRDDNDLWG